MTDITLVPVTGSSNISAMNNNFVKIQNAINNDAVNLTGGNNVMGQDLDMNGHSLLNLGSTGPDALLTQATGDLRYYNVSGDTLAGPMNANDQPIINLPAAVAPSSPVRKQEFDAAIIDATSDLEGRLANATDITKGADLIGLAPNIPGGQPSTVAMKIREVPTVVDFMSPTQKSDFFAKTGLVDQTSAISAFWQYIKSTFIDVSSEDYVKVVGKIPAGLYRIDGSVNFTNIKARNTIIEANGAVFHGRGAANNVVDMTGTRWLQIHGLTIFGDEIDPPKCGLLMGPQTTETSGNNMFVGMNVTGHFLKTAGWNIGSETTTYFRTRFANYNQDPAAKVYIGDGRMRNGATSAYAPLRAFGVAVSFTNNQFYSCDLRNIGGGSPVWLEFTRGWGFDRGCYFISYNDAIFDIWQTSTSVHQNLSIEGLMETTFIDFPVVGNTGCKHQIKFVGDGTASTLEGFTFKVGVPHTALSSIKQDASVGAVAITNADILIGHQLTPGVPVFDAPTLTITGRMQSANAAEFNVNTIAAFNGIFTNTGSGAVRPAAGVYVEMNSTSGQLLLGGSGPRVYDAVYRTEGALADVAFKGRGKGAGNAELGNEVLLNAFTVQAPTGAVNGLSAKASLTVPSYTVQSVSATLNVGVRSKGSGTKVEIGDDTGTNAYVEVGGISTFASLQAAGPSANHDIQLSGKGTGLVRFGALTANADAPITGYVTIKTADGVTRKLAVIA